MLFPVWFYLFLYSFMFFVSLLFAAIGWGWIDSSKHFELSEKKKRQVQKAMKIGAIVGFVCVVIAVATHFFE